ncbi:MAG: hypothetical protein KKB81_06230 [Candidatus Margulisbacteria bacterium]|nr:hypothetical protein [Candidatus Margulisiibacteriota bacterium]MBU1021453.1 hypothetical protein [Candidatus Margulisiibacteriota bacterium]MBU1728374.1 hypothetical protein [Candidatus Margulisiibacteriota bacterium]MBU1955883.1 hypothetical protein [Candidatus Margulisiibacteriota bacterium]
MGNSGMPSLQGIKSGVVNLYNNGKQELENVFEAGIELAENVGEYLAPAAQVLVEVVNDGFTPDGPKAHLDGVSIAAGCADETAILPETQVLFEEGVMITDKLENTGTQIILTLATNEFYFSDPQDLSIVFGTQLTDMSELNKAVALADLADQAPGISAETYADLQAVADANDGNVTALDLLYIKANDAIPKYYDEFLAALESGALEDAEGNTIITGTDLYKAIAPILGNIFTKEDGSLMTLEEIMAAYGATGEAFVDFVEVEQMVNIVSNLVDNVLAGGIPVALKRHDDESVEWGGGQYVFRVYENDAPVDPAAWVAPQQFEIVDNVGSIAPVYQINYSQLEDAVAADEDPENDDLSAYADFKTEGGKLYFIIQDGLDPIYSVVSTEGELSGLTLPVEAVNAGVNGLDPVMKYVSVLRAENETETDVTYTYLYDFADDGTLAFTNVSVSDLHFVSDETVTTVEVVDAFDPFAGFSTPLTLVNFSAGFYSEIYPDGSQTETFTLGSSIGDWDANQATINIGSKFAGYPVTGKNGTFAIQASLESTEPEILSKTYLRAEANSTAPASDE